MYLRYSKLGRIFATLLKAERSTKNYKVHCYYW